MKKISETRWHEETIEVDGVEVPHRYKEPATWVCCTTEFHCDGFTNTCPDCGRDYNWNGSLLADRSQWGEETGEHLSDILMIP